MDTRKLGAVAGVVGAVAFMVVSTVAGRLRPDYDAQRMFLSELALGPRGLVQIVTFVMCGVAIMLFARGMRVEFPAARGAVPFLEVAGVGFIGAGLFVMDPLSTRTPDLSWHGLLHGVFGLLFFYSMPIACILFARHFRDALRWRWLAGYSIATGVIALVGGIILRASLGLDHTTRPEWGGVMQRAHHGLLLSWQAVVASRLGWAGDATAQIP
jgi:hypothetical protein